MAGSFVDRLQLVLKARKWEPNDWARRANLPSVSHVSTMLARGARRPAAETVAALADAAGVSAEWLATGRGVSGLGMHPTTSDGVDTDAPPPTSESEAPRLMNLQGWADLVATAQALDEARGVPQWAFDLLGWSNGLVTVPLVPSSIVELAKLVMKYTSPADAEAALSKLRSSTGRP